MEIVVLDNNIEQAIRGLKKKQQREGIARECKMRRYFEKPCQKRARKLSESCRRDRKLKKKRLEREGGA